MGGLQRIKKKKHLNTYTNIYIYTRRKRILITMAKICIATDFHLSYRQYGIEEREKDFYQQYDKLIQSTIQEKPDLFLILGDIFDTPYPKPISISRFEEGLTKLQKNNIPTYGIIGNHTHIQRKDYYPIDNIFHEKYTILNETHISLDDDDTFLGGVHYHPRTHNIQPIIEELYEKAQTCKTKILLLHQILQEDMGIGYEYSSEELGLDRFDYVFLGHLHKRTTRITNGTVYHYPGSLNSCSTLELVDELEQGRGYTVLDTATGELNIRNLNPPRPYKEYEIDDETIKQYPSNIIESLNQCPIKPIVQLKTTQKHLAHIVESKPEIEKHSLSVKIQKTIQKDEPETSHLLQSLESPHDMIEHILNEHFDEEWKAYLSIDLYKMLSQGNIEGAKELADKVFIEQYPHINRKV